MRKMLVALAGIILALSAQAIPPGLYCTEKSAPVCGEGPVITLCKCGGRLLSTGYCCNRVISGTSCISTSYVVAVAKAGGGTGTVSASGGQISCGSSCFYSYPVGTVITLSATPDSGSTFEGWLGPCSGTGTCAVVVSRNRSVRAVFTSP